MRGPSSPVSTAVSSGPKRSSRAARVGVRGEELARLEVVVGAGRHHLDEAHVEGAVEGEGGQPLEVLAVALQEDGVELDRIEPGGERRLDAAPDLGDVAAAGDGAEALGVEGVDADVDPVDAGRAERRGEAGELGAVGRQRQVLEAGEGLQPPHDVEQVLAHQRLAAGQPHPPDAEPHQGADHRLDLLRREEVAVAEGEVGVLRQAVGAAQVAAVGDRDPQVGEPPPEGVDQPGAGRASSSSAGGPASAGPRGEAAGFRGWSRMVRGLIQYSCPRAAGSSPRLSKHGRRPGFPDRPIGLLSRRFPGRVRAGSVGWGIVPGYRPGPSACRNGSPGAALDSPAHCS